MTTMTIPARLRTLSYWFFTLVIAWEMAAGSLWDLLRIEFVRGAMEHLGYPQYMLFILGVWKLPCAATLLLPRFPRLKEWAYAGALFNYSGAAASHLFAGDSFGHWFGPALFGALTLASWALRPSERRLAAADPAPALAPAAWLVPVVLLVVMVVIALATLPQGR